MYRQAFFAVLVPLALLAGNPVRASVPVCPNDVETPAPASGGPLPLVATALKSGRLDVLAIGSGTMLGARGRREGSFPDRMVEELRTASPGTDIHLTVQGERGMTAAAMLGILRKELSGKPVGLVVWQTGTVEAVRKLPPEDFARILEEGAEAVHAAGADLILVDPPFSRLLQSHSTLGPYRDAMAQVASQHHAVLFGRFALIRQWVEAGELDLENAAKPDRPKVAERLNSCLGLALAHTVLRAVGIARR